ncbi:ferrous iron transporter B, partial [bacterium]|nr:ferrous iron transporter B [bacterium]
MKNIQCNFLLIGNPNTGKSTFFSVMTGKNAQIGNRPGVTVDSQKATFDKKLGWTIEDLPGIYYLDSEYHAQALDQQVTLSRLNDIEINDFIINIIDCRLLRRNLYLSLQLIEFQHPMILVLNFNDDPLLPAFLEETLGLNVLTWAQAQDSDQLKKVIEDPKRIPKPNHLPVSSQLNNHFEQRQHLTQNKLLTWDIAQRSELREFTQHLQNVTGSADAETALATIRYKFIDESHISGRLKNFDALSENIDRVVMHRYAGIPVFLIIMYTTFWLTIVFGGALTTVIESLIEIPFLYCTQFINQYFLLLFISSLGIGIQTLASFIVPIFILYSILGFLEQSGYMQRAALVIDKLMQYLKLPGQSFVPIIVGFGCNVPAIMSSRTLDYERDRIQTILMSPFMSCSARLAIFTVFANSFFGTQGYKIIFALYVFG